MSDFTPKTSEQILKDAVDYLYHNTNLSDFNVGSVIRTLLEVMATEDAAQYFQMFNILESFFLRTATGAALTDRAKDYNVTRVPALSSSGRVVFLDTNLKKSFLISDVFVGDPVLYVEDVSEFPSPPFLAQLGETSNVERVQISAVTIADNSLTIDTTATPPFDAITYDHPRSSTGVDDFDNLTSMVTLFDSAQPPRVIPSGVTLRAQPTNVTFPIECLTSEVGMHPTGYFVSNPVKVKSNSVGTQSNIPAKRLNQISGGSPYSGAAVLNPDPIAGGTNAESDTVLRDRVRASVASLPRGTVAALATNLLGVTNPATDQTVTRVRIVEDFTSPTTINTGYSTVYAYIDDSSISFIPDEERHESDSLAADVPAPAIKYQISLNNITDFPTATTSNSPYIIIDPVGSPFITQYQSISSSTLTNLVPGIPVGTSYVQYTTVSVCEILDSNTEKNKKYFQTNKYPIGDDGITLFKSTSSLGPATKLIQLLPGKVKTFTAAGTLVEDFIINEALGQIEFFGTKIPEEGSAIAAIYENYTGLIKQAQNVVDGNLLNLSVFPGIRSAGVKVLVRPAKRTPVNVTIEITIDTNATSLDTVQFVVRQVLMSYVNSLDIGEDVLVAELIDRTMAVFGITNCKIVTPSADFTINHDSVAYTADIIIL